MLPHSSACKKRLYVDSLAFACLLFDVFGLNAEQSFTKQLLSASAAAAFIQLCFYAIQITHLLSLTLSFPMCHEQCVPWQPALHAAANLHLLQHASRRFLFQVCKPFSYGHPACQHDCSAQTFVWESHAGLSIAALQCKLDIAMKYVHPAAALSARVTAHTWTSTTFRWKRQMRSLRNRSTQAR